jgi:hypothetical protein
MLHVLSQGYYTIGRIKSNRFIYPAGLKLSVFNFAKLIDKSETCPDTAGEDTLSYL